MEGNRDDAERCYEMGRAALEGGDQARAAKLLAKSVRLFPLPKAEKLLAQIKHAPEANVHHANGVNGGHSSHHRKRTHAAAAADDAAGPSVSSGSPAAAATPEQIAIVKRIRSTTDYYEVLQLSKDCAEEDVRKAYRKIALKLHPDKNQAPGAEEAFKTVSKAFSCLSDKDKRANYDRFGHEDGAQGRLQQQRQGGGRQAYYEEFDPNDIFNAFFYGMNGQGQHFRTHMHNRQRRAQQQRAGSDDAVNLTGLIQLIPVLMLLIASYFYNQSEPAFSLARENGFLTELRTERLNIPFYVKSAERFQTEYPVGKQNRARVEHAVEDQFRQQLESKCSYEQMQHQYLINRGRKQEARDMHMPYCELLSSTFRYNAPFRRYVH
eukprot:jgi/Chlat1/3051/Chrsp208S03294